MKLNSARLTGLFLSLACSAAGRSGHGLIGYGISMYKPTCAYACRASITNPLNCSMNMDQGMDMDMDMDTSESPMPECYATNDAFLQTLAYCLHTYCTTELNSTLQKYWETNVVGTLPGQPLPKESYQDALQAIHGTPPAITNSSTLLVAAALVPEDVFLPNWRTLTVFEKVETSHQRYGLVHLLAGAIIPIGLSFARFLPFPAGWWACFEAYLISPPLMGYRHNVPYWNTFNMPTRGQSFFIAYLIAINVILCAVSIESTRPSLWFSSTRREIITYVSNRAGVLSMANIPLLVLFSGRNNVLLWVTNWSHSTFLLLHRWIAVIAVIEACLHSAIYLHIHHVDLTYATESKLPSWYWGAIATVSMVIILPASLIPVRRKCYEFFLAWHVFFFLLVLIGTFLHIYYRSAWKWGYGNWVYTAFAIWGFDRILRLLRLARHGIRTAHITIIDDDYIKLHVPGVQATGHVYLYFPTLTWRIWENHPFSVLTDTYPVTTTTSSSSSATATATETPISLETKDSETTKHPETDTLTIENIDIPLSLQQTHHHHHQSTPQTQSQQHQSNNNNNHNHNHNPFHRHGLTLYLRIHNGITSSLRGPHTTLPILIEPASRPVSIAALDYTTAPNIIAFAGGVGITALTTKLLSHRGYHKLFWAVRSTQLIKAVRESLSGSGSGDGDGFERLNAVVYQDRRMDIPRILADEVARFGGEAVTVVVSGPAKMVDQARWEVSRLGRGGGKGVVVSFVEESFSW
ncbi:ferric reductase like transmembrane component-domain-containing protein [Aspergillus cavernicola]|uniref:Ferric reductase like transmembrane component-domain-containing protein n=1 Tax=Aspergillus cavernicola TaxID=176166 RepID=A0ABR4IIE5_9EURO